MRILNADQMRDADRRTIEEIGIPSLVLMENAGRQAVAAMESRFADAMQGRVGILCGRGNNGGDGFVIARTLLQRGIAVAVFVVGDVAGVKGDARVNLDILGRLGVTVAEVTNEQTWDLHSSDFQKCTLAVDALFGTGLKAPLTGLFETIVADVNATSIPVVAVDLPSGMSADTSDEIGPCIEAAMTVTMGAPKLPLVLPPAEAKAGEIVIADIGIPADVIAGLDGPWIELLTREEIRALVNPRPSDSHKGDYGRVLVVAGSRGKAGAAHLAGLAALRSGAGLVTVATAASAQPIVAAMAPEYMTEPLVETSDGRINASALEQVLALDADVIACGPGLGRGPETTAFVLGLLDRAEVPLVLDADALNAVTEDPARLTGSPERSVIITPHPGEMARLLGASVDDVQANRVELARELARTQRVFVVLKGFRTLIVTPDGTVYINPTGNPGMATGGTGDVLTGMVAAWLAQTLDPEAACRLAVYLHGTAGDLAEAAEGEIAMTATDLLANLGDAVLEVTARQRVVPKST